MEFYDEECQMFFFFEIPVFSLTFFHPHFLRFRANLNFEREKLNQFNHTGQRIS